MDFDINTANHTCNVIRRETQAEYPNVTPVFIVYKTGERKKTIETKREEFKEHPAGKHFMSKLRQHMKEDKGIGTFLGFAKARKNSLFSFFSPEQYLGVIFINHDHFENVEQFRFHALGQIWHFLHLIREHKTGREENILREERVISPRLKPTEQAMHNLLADAFSAIYLEKTGHKASIEKLAKIRSVNTLRPTPSYKAEEYPFPIALDAAQIIYDEYVAIPQMKTKPMHQAYDMVEEIGETFDESNIRQWWVFSRSAQEMAWMNVDPHKILSTAIYTSEDPYVRATGYIVAEAVSIDPPPLTNIDFYNAFTDPEVNERNHFRACEEGFQALASTVLSNNNSIYFKKAAIDQNKGLLDGKLLGWCAYALLKANQVFDGEGKIKSILQQAKEEFDLACRAIPWDRLIEFNNVIIRHRIQGDEITMERLLAIAGQDETFKKLYEAFDLSIKEADSVADVVDIHAEPEPLQTIDEYLEEEQANKAVEISVSKKKTNLSLEDE